MSVDRRERHGRKDIHVRYRSDKHGEAETIVSPELLASMDDWSFLPHLKRPRQ